MNKQQEIAELKRFIKTLQETGDSYIGQWLKEQLPMVEDALKSDLYPSVNCIGFLEFGAKRQAILDEANKEANKIVTEARAKAANHQAAIEKNMDAARNNLHAALRALER